MQRWEYLWMRYIDDYENSKIILWLNDERSEIEPDKGIEWHLMNRLGEQGWELIDRDTVSNIFVFKRPKS